METLNIILDIVILVIILALFAFREYITKYIGSKINHDFNIKLESIKHELKKRESTIDSLNRYFENRSLQKNSYSEIRRAQAAEKLWLTVVEHDRFLGLAGMIAIMRFPKAYELSGKNQKFRDFFKTLTTSNENILSKINENQNHPKKEKPFIDTYEYSLFELYESILTFYHLRAKLLSDGIDEEGFFKKDELVNVAKKLLPHHESYLEKHGIDGTYYLLEEIKNIILSYVRKTVLNTEISKEEIKTLIMSNNIHKIIDKATEGAPDIPDEYQQNIQRPDI